MLDGTDAAPEEALETAERADSSRAVKRKAASGVLFVAARSVAMRFLGLLGNIVLARLLTPSDFGIVAIGYVVMNAGTVLTDGGLGAALVRGPIAPSRRDLEAVVAFQLAGALLVVGAAAAIATALGSHALITVVMVAALPVLAFRAPGAISLERELNYKPLVTVDVLETGVYNVWAIGSVALGAGVWGLATAVVVKSATGTAVLARVSPAGFVRPRPSWLRIRPFFGFGMRYQAIALSSLARDQGLNTLAGSIGGLSTLGLWTLAYRNLQPAALVFDALRRVSYPALARLKELGEDARELIPRILALASLGSSFVLAPLAAVAPALVPLVFGDQWSPCADAISLIAWSMLFGGPLSVAVAGYLFSEGDAQVNLRITILHTLAWLIVSAAALPFLGVAAMGLGGVASAAVDLVSYHRVLRARVPGLNMIRALAPSVSVATIAALAGWAVAEQGHATIPRAVLSVVVTLGILGAGAALVARGTLVELATTVRESVGAARAKAQA